MSLAENSTRLKASCPLSDRRSQSYRRRSMPSRSGKTFESISPIDQASIATVARGDSADVDAAAKGASDAFPSWRDLDGASAGHPARIADGIVARAEEIALLECIDTGQAFRFMSKAALRGAENFQFLPTRRPMRVTARAFMPPVNSM